MRDDTRVLGSKLDKRTSKGSLRDVDSFLGTIGRLFDLCFRKIKKATERRGAWGGLLGAGRLVRKHWICSVLASLCAIFPEMSD